MTNIIRDVGKDLRNGRIYLPQEDLARFDYSETELQDRQYNERFVQLMEFEAAARDEFFARAAALLPREDRRSMVAAEIMASVYHGLLRKMEHDGFRVFEKEYRLSKIEKGGRIYPIQINLNAPVSAKRVHAELGQRPRNWLFRYP